MLKNYYITAIRHLQNQYIYFLINIIGLGIGLGASFLLLLFAINEFNYDNYHPMADQTFRILTHNLEKNEYDGRTPYLLAEMIRHQLSDVENVCQLYSRDIKFLLANQELSGEFHWTFTSQQFFQIFHMPMKAGQIDLEKDPYQIYISEKLAEHYFPDVDPIDQTISIDENNFKATLRIAGVFETLPSNTHLKADVIAPLMLAMRIYNHEEFAGFEMTAFASWDRISVFTYIQINKGAEIGSLAGQLKKMTRSHLKNPENTDYDLQPIQAIHLHSAHINNNYGPHGNVQQILLLLAIAFLILVVAVFNFILLLTAQHNTRLQEIGLRKVLGAHKNNIIHQTLIESIITAFLSLPIALLFAELSLPLFNTLVQKNLRLFEGENWLFAVCVVGLTALAGALSGGYTALSTSRFQPHHILKNHLPFHSKSIIRRLLVGAQFAIFTGLLICTFTIAKQFYFIQHKNLGYDKEHLITIPLNNEQQIANYPVLKTKLKSSPYIPNVSGASYTPPTETFMWAKFGDSGKGIEYICVDVDYFETMGIAVQNGSVFSESKTSEHNGIVVTASSIPYFELEQPLGHSLFGIGPILGVVDDFHIRSLHRSIRPALFKLRPDKIRTVVLRVKPNMIAEAIKDMERIWKQVNQNSPFSFQFVDEALNQAYRDEMRFSRLMQIFTVLAIIIASMGLFGMSLFMVVQKTKEIGTRKVLGASVMEIIFMLTLDFTKWIIIANVVAWPVAWYVMNKWLQNFAYRTDIDIFLFVSSGLAALIIAFLSVSWQAVRAATQNPVEALRYE